MSNPRQKCTFDELPDIAFVRSRDAFEICAIARSTGYALSRRGQFPRIEKIFGGRSSGIRAGALREWLRDPAAYRAPEAAK